MSSLANITKAVEAFNERVSDRVHRSRDDGELRAEIRERWDTLQESIREVETPTGLRLPSLALPSTEDPGEQLRYLEGEGPPGQFPFVNSIYPEMYLGDREEPTRLFAGLGLAEDTNERFHYLTKHQKSLRLSTAFDGPTLYGVDSDEDDVFGKIGEGGVAIDTLEDMERLYEGFPLEDPQFSVSMTINGPAPTILAMFVAMAKRKHGEGVLTNLRGTVQADILKEVQAQNESLFAVDASLRFLADMVDFAVERMPRWYPISISGYHIAEAGATPVQQAAYTLSNGFSYVEQFLNRGMKVNQFGPRLSFFLDCGLDVEYLVLARVCRKLWAIGMRDVFDADERTQKFRLHTQTSGRSLVAAEFENNLTRTGVELMLAYINATNSCHSNSADEPFTTPSEHYARLASHAQSILLEESGLFKHTMNLLSGSPGMQELEKRVEAAILEEFREIDRLGGVLPAMEHRYQRSQIQWAAHRHEQAISDGTRPIVGVNRYASEAESKPVELARIPKEKKKRQIERLIQFKRANQDKAPAALDRLAEVVTSGGNVFAELISTVEVCSLGQITQRLQEVAGPFRPSL